MDSNFRCTYHAQSLEIKFSMEGANADVLVDTNAEWITNLKTTSNKSITANIAENSDTERTTTITLSAPGYKSVSIRLKQNGVPTSTANHTLMFYFFGTSLNSYFSTNIADAKLAIEKGALGDNNRVVFFRQRSQSVAYIVELCYDPDSGKCFESIIEDNIIIDETPLTSNYISRTINRLSSIAPAERYGLVLAGHGTAWIPRESPGISKYGAWIPFFIPVPDAEVTRHFGEKNVLVNPSDIAEGITDSNIDIDYILFDACFMSNIETIYELRNSANYIIASPCEIMGRGFPYERTLPHLFKDNGTCTDYTAAAESYYIYYRDEYSSSSRCASVAVYDCSEIDALQEATKEVIKSATEDYDDTQLQTYEGHDQHYFYDFGEWVNVVATDSAALQNFNTQLTKTVIAKYTIDTFYTMYGYTTLPINIDVYSGVTTSAPSKALNTLWRETMWYKSIWEL
ncbi:MAG: hypothetical protein J6U73_05655 [Alistipes sp.]|nr:hypothetical protein [Alistipes sp.]